MSKVNVRTAGLVGLWALLASSAASADTPLPIDSAHWSEQLFNLGSIAPADAATFAVVNDPPGSTSLAIGPWRAGLWSARFQYRTPLPQVTGTVTGRYRTEGCPPMLPLVHVQAVDSSGARVGLSVRPLAPALDWQTFSAPIRRPPATATATVVGLGLADYTECRALFTDVTVLTAPFVTVFPAQPGPLERPRAPLPWAPASSWRLAFANKAWWLVTPQGRATFSLGVDPPHPADAAQGRSRLQTLEALGFNSLAGWSDVWAYAPRLEERAGQGTLLAATHAFETASLSGTFETLVDASGVDPQPTHAFPDPFDPAWEQALRAEVVSVKSAVANRQWMLGYFADNEVSYADLHRRVYSSHCSQAFGQFLAARYPQGIAELNTRWGTSYASFADLLAQKPDPVLRKGPMYDDFKAFKRVLVQRYVETGLRVIREEDPGRLVFSNRFMLGDQAELEDVIDLFAAFDGIAVNAYPDNLEPGLGAEVRATLSWFHERTGRPVMVTEWSVPALDSGLYQGPKLDWSYPQCVDTQTERARQAAKITAELYGLPFVVGALWFIWSDYDSATRQANRGLFQADGGAWSELQSALAAVHLGIAGHLADAGYLDAGTPADAGTPPIDAGTPSADAGTPPEDAGQGDGSPAPEVGRSPVAGVCGCSGAGTAPLAALTALFALACWALGRRPRPRPRR